MSYKVLNGVQWKTKTTVTLYVCEKCWYEQTWKIFVKQHTTSTTSSTGNVNFRKWASLTTSPWGL